jgi:cytochrome c
MLRQIALAAAIVASQVMPAIAADPAAGEAIFKKKCFTCHAVGDGATNKLGPELNGLFGRAAGSVPGYNYSTANKTSGIVWDEQVFATYIRNPRGSIPGTKMAFAGLKSDEEIADLVAYLGRFAADGKTVD